MIWFWFSNLEYGHPEIHWLRTSFFPLKNSPINPLPGRHPSYQCPICMLWEPTLVHSPRWTRHLAAGPRFGWEMLLCYGPLQKVLVSEQDWRRLEKIGLLIASELSECGTCFINLHWAYAGWVSLHLQPWRYKPILEASHPLLVTLPNKVPLNPVVYHSVLDRPIPMLYPGRFSRHILIIPIIIIYIHYPSLSP